VKKGSSIYKLNPVLIEGVLRVGGRLKKIAMPVESNHPAILPKGSHLSRLHLSHVHNMVGHCRRNQMLSKLRQNYWISKANSAARKIVADCLLCRCWHASVSDQKKTALPPCHITPDLPPFTHVGIDYFGPIKVKRGRNRVKR